MSDNNLQECSLCGLNGSPPPNCDMCHGGAPVQPRAYTLSDQRAGRAPQDDRYGGESLNLKTSSLVVGGAIHHPSHPQN